MWSNHLPHMFTWNPFFDMAAVGYGLPQITLLGGTGTGTAGGETWAYLTPWRTWEITRILPDVFLGVQIFLGFFPFWGGFFASFWRCCFFTGRFITSGFCNTDCGICLIQFRGCRCPCWTDADPNGWGYLLPILGLLKSLPLSKRTPLLLDDAAFKKGTTDFAKLAASIILK